MICPYGHEIRSEYDPKHKGYYCDSCHRYWTGGDMIYWSDHLGCYIGGDRDHGSLPAQTGINDVPVWDDAEEIVPIIAPPPGGLKIRLGGLRGYAYSGDQRVLGFILDVINGHGPEANDPPSIITSEGSGV